LLIREEVIERIIENLDIKVTNETTPEEMLQVIKKVVFEAINSIDENEVYKIISEIFTEKMRF
jgi:hypothetical protein